MVICTTNVPNLNPSTKDNTRSPNRIQNDVKPDKSSLRRSVSQIDYAVLFGVQKTRGLGNYKKRKQDRNLPRVSVVTLVEPETVQNLDRSYEASTLIICLGRKSEYI